MTGIRLGDPTFRSAVRALTRDLVAVACLLLSAGAAIADPLYVNQAVVGGSGDGSNWGNAFADLQDALAVALPGDEIWVAAGVYVPSLETSPGDPRSVTFDLPSGVAIYGGFTGVETSLGERNPDPLTNLCILDGSTASGKAYHVVTATDSLAGTVLDGFMITNGHANGGTFETDRGAGLVATDATLDLGNLWLLANATTTDPDGEGGGMWIGGGMVTIHDSTFEGNSGSWGGGIYVINGTLEVSRTRFFRNNGFYAGGGGLYAVLAADVRVVDSTFQENIANNEGGAIVSRAEASVRVEQTTFFGNVTRGAGGAIYVFDNAQLIATNSVFVGNAATIHAGGNGGAIDLKLGSAAVLTNCTVGHNVADHNGGGIAVFDSGQLTVQNAVFFGNTDGLNGGDVSAQQIYLDPMGTPVVAVSYSLVEGGFPGTGNINDNPIFVATPDPGDGSWETPGDNDYNDVHVQDESPVIDAGSNFADLDGSGPELTTIADVLIDRDGAIRLLDDPQTTDTGLGTAPIVDMGAFELSIFSDGFESGDTARWWTAVP